MHWTFTVRPHRSSNKIWGVKRTQTVTVGSGKPISGSPDGPGVLSAIAEPHSWMLTPQILWDMLSLFQQPCSISHTRLAHKRVPGIMRQVFLLHDFTTQSSEAQQVFQANSSQARVLTQHLTSCSLIHGAEGALASPGHRSLGGQRVSLL